MYSVGEPVEIEEIMGRVKMNEEKAIRVMTRLQNTGYVEEV
jgi:DNA-binding IscR family transcriptional regulator